jgi:hypothetical protein
MQQQQPIFEFTNFQEFAYLLNDIKELTEKQGRQIEKQSKQIKKIKKLRRCDAIELRMNNLECRIICLQADRKVDKLQIAQLEKEKEAQKSKISELESDILEINKSELHRAFVHISNLREAVREMGARLLNQHTQKGAWRELKSMFYEDGSFDFLNEEEDLEWSTNTSKWGQSFTTPQGDDNERRIARIEEKLRMFSGEFRD